MDFSKNQHEKIDELIQKCENGHEDESSNVGRGGTIQNVDPNYQLVSWKIIKPNENMLVSISQKDMLPNQYDAKIKSISTNQGFVDTVDIESDDGSAKLVIINGTWQVFGKLNDHQINFTIKL